MPAFGLDFSNPGFVECAESYGAHRTRIQRTEQLVEELEAALAMGGVHGIKVPIDDSENETVFLEELKARTCILQERSP